MAVNNYGKKAIDRTQTHILDVASQAHLNISGTPIQCIYFATNREYSSHEKSTGTAQASIGIDSPFRYNKILNFIVYKVEGDEASTKRAHDDEQNKSIDEKREGLFHVPSLFEIIPQTNDYFYFEIPGIPRRLFRVIDTEQSNLTKGIGGETFTAEMTTYAIDSIPASHVIETTYFSFDMVNKIANFTDSGLLESEREFYKILDTMSDLLDNKLESFMYSGSILIPIDRSHYLYDPYMNWFLKIVSNPTISTPNLGNENLKGEYDNSTWELLRFMYNTSNLPNFTSYPIVEINERIDISYENNYYNNDIRMVTNKSKKSSISMCCEVDDDVGETDLDVDLEPISEYIVVTDPFKGSDDGYNAMQYGFVFNFVDGIHDILNDDELIERVTRNSSTNNGALYGRSNNKKFIHGKQVYKDNDPKAHLKKVHTNYHDSIHKKDIKHDEHKKENFPETYENRNKPEDKNIHYKKEHKGNQDINSEDYKRLDKVSKSEDRKKSITIEEIEMERKKLTNDKKSRTDNEILDYLRKKYEKYNIVDGRKKDEIMENESSRGKKNHTSDDNHKKTEITDFGPTIRGKEEKEPTKVTDRKKGDITDNSNGRGDLDTKHNHKFTNDKKVDGVIHEDETRKDKTTAGDKKTEVTTSDLGYKKKDPDLSYPDDRKKDPDTDATDTRSKDKHNYKKGEPDPKYKPEPTEHDLGYNKKDDEFSYPDDRKKDPNTDVTTSDRIDHKDGEYTYPDGHKKDEYFTVNQDHKEDKDKADITKKGMPDPKAKPEPTEHDLSYNKKDPELLHTDGRKKDEPVDLDIDRSNKGTHSEDRKKTNTEIYNELRDKGKKHSDIEDRKKTEVTDNNLADNKKDPDLSYPDERKKDPDTFVDNDRGKDKHNYKETNGKKTDGVIYEDMRDKGKHNYKFTDDKKSQVTEHDLGDRKKDPELSYPDDRKKDHNTDVVDERAKDKHNYKETNGKKVDGIVGDEMDRKEDREKTNITTSRKKDDPISYNVDDRDTKKEDRDEFKYADRKKGVVTEEDLRGKDDRKETINEDGKKKHDYSVDSSEHEKKDMKHLEGNETKKGRDDYIASENPDDKKVGKWNYNTETKKATEEQEDPVRKKNGKSTISDSKKTTADYGHISPDFDREKVGKWNESKDRGKRTETPDIVEKQLLNGDSTEAPLYSKKHRPEIFETTDNQTDWEKKQAEILKDIDSNKPKPVVTPTPVIDTSVPMTDINENNVIDNRPDQVEVNKDSVITKPSTITDTTIIHPTEIVDNAIIDQTETTPAKEVNTFDRKREQTVETDGRKKSYVTDEIDLSDKKDITPKDKADITKKDDPDPKAKPDVIESDLSESDHKKEKKVDTDGRKKPEVDIVDSTIDHNKKEDGDFDHKKKQPEFDNIDPIITHKDALDKDKADLTKKGEPQPVDIKDKPDTIESDLSYQKKDKAEVTKKVIEQAVKDNPVDNTNYDKSKQELDADHKKKDDYSIPDNGMDGTSKKTDADKDFTERPISEELHEGHKEEKNKDKISKKELENIEDSSIADRKKDEEYSYPVSSKKKKESAVEEEDEAISWICKKQRSTSDLYKETPAYIPLNIYLDKDTLGTDYIIYNNNSTGEERAHNSSMIVLNKDRKPYKVLYVHTDPKGVLETGWQKKAYLGMFILIPMYTGKDKKYYFLVGGQKYEGIDVGAEVFGEVVYLTDSFGSLSAEDNAYHEADEVLEDHLPIHPVNGDKDIVFKSGKTMGELVTSVAPVVTNAVVGGTVVSGITPDDVVSWTPKKAKMTNADNYGDVSCKENPMYKILGGDGNAVLLDKDLKPYRIFSTFDGADALFSDDEKSKLVNVDGALLGLVPLYTEDDGSYYYMLNGKKFSGADNGAEVTEKVSYLKYDIDPKSSIHTDVAISKFTFDNSVIIDSKADITKHKMIQPLADDTDKVLFKDLKA